MAKEEKQENLEDISDVEGMAEAPEAPEPRPSSYFHKDHHSTYNHLRKTFDFQPSIKVFIKEGLSSRYENHFWTGSLEVIATCPTFNLVGRLNIKSMTGEERTYVIKGNYSSPSKLEKDFEKLGRKITRAYHKQKPLRLHV